MAQQYTLETIIPSCEKEEDQFKIFSSKL